MKNFLWILLYIAAFAVFFLVFVRIGISIPVSKYANSLKTEWNEDIGSITTDLPYGQWENATYDLYIPKILKENKEIECLILGERTFLDVEK